MSRKQAGRERLVHIKSFLSKHPVLLIGSSRVLDSEFGDQLALASFLAVSFLDSEETKIINANTRILEIYGVFPSEAMGEESQLFRKTEDDTSSHKGI